MDYGNQGDLFVVYASNGEPLTDYLPQDEAHIVLTTKENGTQLLNTEVLDERIAQAIHFEHVLTESSAALGARLTACIQLGLGGNNCIFLIKFVDGREAVFRAAVTASTVGFTSVSPEVRAMCEVALINFLCANSTLRVPRVLASNTELQNSVGAPWSILEFLPGKTLERAWSSMNLTTKMIGSCYPSNSSSGNIEIGRLVTARDGPGIFSSTWSYIEWLLNSVSSNTGMIGNSEENARSAAAVADRSRTTAQRWVAIASSERRTDIHRAVLAHLDAEPRNWLTLADGTITGLIDWELHAILPAVFAIDYPIWIRYDANLDPRFADCEPRQMGETQPLLEHYWEEAPGVALHLRELYLEVTKRTDEEYALMLTSCEKLRGLHNWLSQSKRDIGLRRLNKWLDMVES
ncbi:hypothetical protein FRC07_000820 [Ceratobasidium sp. 392]|nr:hypothetical protein FRC07_000820 [Ceratobasidium sp. 392]